MKKKIIGIVTVMMLILPVFGSFATAENTPLKSIEEITIINKDIKSNSIKMINFGSTTEISTIGPVSPMLNIAEIIIIAGPYFRTFIIRLLLVSMKAYFLLPDISIPINDLTFAIRYKKNIATFPFFEGYSYNTTIIENATETTFTNKHILLVSGFDGTFEFSRADIMNFIPAKFKFEGTCEDAIVAS
jgi:hypothetical protein